MEGEPVGNEIYGSETTATERQCSRPLTTSRIINFLLIVSYGVSIVFNIVCLIVMVIKHNKMVDKTGPNYWDEELVHEQGGADTQIPQQVSSCDLQVCSTGGLCLPHNDISVDKNPAI